MGLAENLDYCRKMDNQTQEQTHEGENGSSNNVDVPEIELIIKVTR